MSIIKTVKDMCIGFGIGVAIGFMRYIERIQEHWWWIFLAVLEIILIPLKLVILIPTMIACACSKRFSNWLIEKVSVIFE